jgi:hypothetical protein
MPGNKNQEESFMGTNPDWLVIGGMVVGERIFIEQQKGIRMHTACPLSGAESNPRPIDGMKRL